MKGGFDMEANENKTTYEIPRIQLISFDCRENIAFNPDIEYGDVGNLSF